MMTFDGWLDTELKIHGYSTEQLIKMANICRKNGISPDDFLKIMQRYDELESSIRAKAFEKLLQEDL